MMRLFGIGGRQGAGAVGLGVTHEFRKRGADGALDGAGIGNFAEAAHVDKDGVLVAEELARRSCRKWSERLRRWTVRP